MVNCKSLVGGPGLNPGNNDVSVGSATNVASASVSISLLHHSCRLSDVLLPKKGTALLAFKPLESDLNRSCDE